MFFPRLRLLLSGLVLVLAIVGLRRAEAYALTGYTWPDGSQIVMHLSLTHSPSSFPDGTGSWDGSATDALNIWNQYISKVQFVAGSAVTPVQGDGLNSVFFSNSVYGQAWGTGVLAITLYTASGGNFDETEVIFNDKLKWSSYRGNLIGSGPSGTYDFHRVALHEFGHVLGLDHPDEHGQSVVAQMNSITSDLDHLADDDIAGARFLYGLTITSSQYNQYVTSGDQFSYQITANNQPTGYSAMGLPDGLQIDSTTGLISGHCIASGTFVINIVVQGALGTATGSLQLNVQGLPLTSFTPPILITGQFFTYQITAGNNPATFSAASLPTGVTLDSNTGILSGAVASAGYFPIVVKARGATSEAAGTVQLWVEAPTLSGSFFFTPDVGSSFSYQITANSFPTSFAATNLPTGLTLNTVTGQITGVATLSGFYQVELIAHGPYGDATGTLSVKVNALKTPTIGARKLAVNGTGSILADPMRGRLYVAKASGIDVIDMATEVVITTIAGNLNEAELNLSANGKLLFICNPVTNTVRRIDLDTLNPLPDLAVNGFFPWQICEGVDGRLYVTSSSESGIYQVDAVTGAALSRFTPNPYGYMGGCDIVLSPDRRVLFANDHLNGFMVKYDISGSAPVLLQSAQGTGNGGPGLAITPDGQWVVQGSAIRSAANLTNITGSFSPPDLQTLFSADGALAFRTSNNSQQISIFNFASHQLTRAIVLPDDVVNTYGARIMALDASGSKLFVTTGSTTTVERAVYAYSLFAAPASTPTHSLLNVSTRLRTQTGDNVLIGGFIISGSEPKQVVVRATGPSLPLAGALADPVLELHSPDGSVMTNDNWNEHRADVIASALAPNDEHEAAIVATLPPGAYTAVLRGLHNTTGVALVELYDLSPDSNSHIGNISTRGKVETGTNVMIGGFIIGGDQPTKVIVRAIGPSLATAGVGGVLADTTLELHDGNGSLVVSNDDWQSDLEQEIIATTIAPTDPRESAIVRTLTPGNYTAIVRGKNNATGVALVEVYNLESN